MTDIQKQALALVNAVRAERRDPPMVGLSRDCFASQEALCRAIEQHEKFKWEVSYAVLSAMKVIMEMAEYDCEVMVRPILDRFIIAKPDPLVEAYNEALPETAAVHGKETVQHICAKISAALAARGLKIVEVGHD